YTVFFYTDTATTVIYTLSLHDALPIYLPGLNNVAVKGLMGMASLTDDRQIIRKEFQYLKSLYDQFSSSVEPVPRHLAFTTLSMGMSNDYPLAIEEGSNMVRLGSLLFGARG